MDFNINPTSAKLPMEGGHRTSPDRKGRALCITHTLLKGDVKEKEGVKEQDWREGSVGKVLAPRQEDPSSASRNHGEKVHMVVCACGSSTGEVETGRSPGLTAQPA